MTYGYIRVSTEEQNTENQRRTIAATYKIDEWVEEKKSGTIDYKKRNLGDLIKMLKTGDVLVVTELSRLGRSLSMVFKIITELQDRKVRCVAIKNNFDMDPNDSSNIVTSVLLFAFGLSAQIERELISERTKQGLAVARAKGKKLGRSKGEIPYYTKLRKNQDEIIKKRQSGRSILSLAKEYGVTWKTMQDFLNVRIYQEKPEPLKECPRKHGHPSYREIEYLKNHGKL